MSCVARLGIDLSAVQPEDSRLRPLALLVDDTDHLRRTHEREIVDREPTSHVRVGRTEHREYASDRYGSLSRWSQGERLASAEMDGGDHLVIDGPVQHGLYGDEVMVDGFGCVTGDLHVPLERVECVDSNPVRAYAFEGFLEPAQMLFVVATEVNSALHLLVVQEFFDDLDDGEGLRGGRTLGLLCLSPLGPLGNVRQVFLVGLLALFAEIVELAAPLGEPLSVGMFLEARGSDVHEAWDSRPWVVEGQAWVVEMDDACRICNQRPGNDLRISPSRTRTYDLAVNSRVVMPHESALLGMPRPFMPDQRQPISVVGSAGAK